MSFACRPNMVASLVVSPLPGGQSFATSGVSVTVTLTFARAGTVLATKSGAAAWLVGPVNHNWAITPSATVGDAFWIRATSTSGTPSTGTVGSWTAMSSDQQWTVTRAVAGGTKSWIATFEIATDAAGANIVGSGSYEINADFP